MVTNKNHSKKIELVGLCEFAFHNEVLRSYILHFTPIANSLLVFTSEVVYEQLYDFHDRSDIKWILYYNHDQLPYYISNNRENFANCNLIVITTLPEQLSSFKPFLFQTRVWIVIHNNNKVFGNLWTNMYFRRGLDFFKDLIKLIISVLNNNRSLYDQIFKQCENIILPSVAIASYNKSHHRQSIFKKPVIIPFAHFDGIMTTLTNNDTVKIVVPGTIMQNIRDYKLLLDAFERALPEIKVKIDLVLLGKLKEDRLVIAFEKAVDKYKDHFSFKYFKEFVDQKYFDKVLADADFLILPLKECVSHMGYKEYFGLTTESGSINDFVRFGKPAILPEFYPIQEGLTPLVRRYHDAKSMAKCILFFIENVKSDRFYSEAKEGLAFFNSAQVSQRIINQWNTE